MGILIYIIKIQLSIIYGKLILKIVALRFFVTLPQFCWQLVFYLHHPTLDGKKTVNNDHETPFIHISGILSAYPSVGPQKITLKILGYGPKS